MKDCDHRAEEAEKTKTNMTTTNSFIRQASHNTMGGLIDPRLLAGKTSTQNEQSILVILAAGFKKITEMVALRSAEQA